MTDVASAVARAGDDTHARVGWWHARRSSLIWLLGAWPVLVALAGAAVAGSLSIPHNDDWSYVKTARILADTGSLHMQGWAGTSLVGQIFLAYPILRVFGSNVAVLNTATALASLVGLSAAYTVFRHFGTTRTAVLGTLVTALFPGYLLLSTSFMSDVPGFAAITTCLAAGLRSLRQRSRAWLWIALALGAVGVTIRYQVAAAPLALLLTWVLLPQQEGDPQRPRRTALAGGAVLAVFVAAFMWWRLTVPYASNPDITNLYLPRLATSVLSAFPVLGLALLPFTALCIGRLRLLSRRIGPWLVAVGSGVTLVLFRRLAGGHVFPGNYLDRLGPYQGAGYGGTPPLVSLRAWHSLETLGWVAGTAALIVLLYAVKSSVIPAFRTAWGGNRLRPLEALLLSVFAVLYAVTVVVPPLTGWPMFDRYLFPLLLPAGVGLLMLAGRVSRSAALCSAASVALLAAGAVVLTTVAARDDTMRWEAGAQLVRQGASPTDVSSGLEWQGTYATSPADFPQLLLTPMPANQYALWTRMFKGDRDCWYVTRAVSPSPHLRLTQTMQYTRFPGLAKGKLYIYHTDFCA